MKTLVVMIFGAVLVGVAPARAMENFSECAQNVSQADSVKKLDQHLKAFKSSQKDVSGQVIQIAKMKPEQKAQPCQTVGTSLQQLQGNLQNQTQAAKPIAQAIQRLGDQDGCAEGMQKAYKEQGESLQRLGKRLQAACADAGGAPSAPPAGGGGGR